MSEDQREDEIEELWQRIHDSILLSTKKKYRERLGCSCSTIEMNLITTHQRETFENEHMLCPNTLEWVYQWRKQRGFSGVLSSS